MVFYMRNVNASLNVAFFMLIYYSGRIFGRLILEVELHYILIGRFNFLLGTAVKIPIGSRTVGRFKALPQPIRVLGVQLATANDD
jgi:hypothetical protein